MDSNFDKFIELKKQLEEYSGKLDELKDDFVIKIFSLSFELLTEDCQQNIRRNVDCLYEDKKKEYNIVKQTNGSFSAAFDAINQLNNSFGVTKTTTNKRDHNEEINKKRYNFLLDNFVVESNEQKILLLERKDIRDYIYEKFFSKIDFLEELKIKIESYLGSHITENTINLEKLLHNAIGASNNTKKEYENFNAKTNELSKLLKKIDKKTKEYQKTINASKRAYITCLIYLICSCGSFYLAYWLFKNEYLYQEFEEIIEIYEEQNIFKFLTFIIYKIPCCLCCGIGLKLLFTSIKYEAEGRQYKALYTYLNLFEDMKEDKQKALLIDLAKHFFITNKEEVIISKFFKKMKFKINLGENISVKNDNE